MHTDERAQTCLHEDTDDTPSVLIFVEYHSARYWY